MRHQRLSFIALLLVLAAMPAFAQEDRDETIPKAPPRAEGEGPFNRLILRGVTLIDGTGAPPVGPVDIIIEKNRIVRIASVGFPGMPIDEKRRPRAEANDKVLDLAGHYVVPGLIDMHGHIGGRAQGTPAEYVFKLWMAHGITTVREPGCGNGLEWVLDQKQKSARNEITAPRLFAYSRFGQGSNGQITTAEQAAAWVDEVAKKGADGLKLSSHRPDIMAALTSTSKKNGIRTAAHLAQLGVARMDVVEAARLGLTTMEHWYGLPESLFTNRTVQNYPLDYNYNNEQHRFGQAGRLWAQAAQRGSEKWNAVIDELIKLDFTIDPTMTIYEASRDLLRARRAEWHEDYTLPSLWRFYQPSRSAHGSYWFYWTTEDEVAWKNNYRIWMSFLNDYKNKGGRVTTGSDSGFIFKLYGFDYIREFELLREAGFHPLEVIRSATLYGAQALGAEKDLGSIEPGKYADLVVLEENPLENLASFYGTGAIKLNDKNEAVRVGGVKYTIKDGIIFDAKKLLADVRRIVADTKAKENFSIKQPGIR